MISPTAVLACVIVLGPTRILERAILDSGVIVGYPIRAKLLKAYSEVDFIEALDKLSDGASIGRDVVIRSNTVIYEHTVIGDKVEFGHNVIVREDTRIGCCSRIGTSTIIDGGVEVGSYVSIQSGVYIPRGTRIGNKVFIGPRAVFTNDRYPPSSRLEGAKVEDEVVIGANAVIVAPVRIGRRAVVAAGAVVVDDVPPETVVAGVPAKPIATRDEYERKKQKWEESGGAAGI